MILKCCRCSFSCEHDAPELGFYKSNPIKGEIKRSNWCSLCKDCTKEYKKSFYVKHKDRLQQEHKEQYERNKPARLRRGAQYRLNKCSAERRDSLVNRRLVVSLDKRTRHLYDRLKHWGCAAKRRNLSFCLTLEDIEKLFKHQNGLCFYSGIEMVLERNSPNTISLDRINSEKGYTVDNVVLCTKVLNLMKHIQSISEFVRLCQKVSKNFENHSFA